MAATKLLRNGTLEERFWARVKKTPPCWLRTGGKRGGYGMVWIQKRGRRAHVYSYRLHRGDIPDGLSVCHTCDVPLCVNPKHLFLGTTTDNMRDKVRKNRQVKGEKQHAAKLTEDAVRYIRKHHIPGHPRFGLPALGRKFGVTTENLRFVVRGITWKHVI